MEFLLPQLDYPNNRLLQLMMERKGMLLVKRTMPEDRIIDVRMMSMYHDRNPVVKSLPLQEWTAYVRTILDSGEAFLMPEADPKMEDYLNLYINIYYDNDDNDEEEDGGEKGPPPAISESIKALPTVRYMKGKERMEKCSVCLDVIMRARVKELPCKHRFHAQCIEKWLGMHGCCPLCRLQLPTLDNNPQLGD